MIISRAGTTSQNPAMERPGLEIIICQWNLDWKMITSREVTTSQNLPIERPGLESIICQ
jgi:hypothetical protein